MCVRSFFPSFLVLLEINIVVLYIRSKRLFLDIEFLRHNCAVICKFFFFVFCGLEIICYYVFSTYVSSANKNTHTQNQSKYITFSLKKKKRLIKYINSKIVFFFLKKKLTLWARWRTIVI